MPLDPGRRLGRRWLAAAVLLVGACQSAVSPSAPAPSIPTASGGVVGTSQPGVNGGPPGGSPSIDLGGSTYQPGAGRNGGPVVIGDRTEANVFQPYFAAKQTDRNVAAAAWASLVKLGPDDHYLADLAESVPTVANGAVTAPGDKGDAMTVTWQLRSGLEWSDGQPLSCDDVRFTWQWILDPDNIGVDTSGFEDMSDVECRSATDMVWHFKRVYEAYLSLLPTPLPRHYLSKIAMSDQILGAGFRPADVAAIPVSGPFKFASDVPGGELRMVSNTHYTNPATGKPSHLAVIAWHWFGDAKSLVAAFKAGQVDVATGLQAGNIPADKTIRARASSQPSLDYESLVLNWSDRGAAGGASVPPGGTCSQDPTVVGRGPGCPTADAAIRRAIAMTIDKGAIVKGVLGGGGQVIDSAVPARAWYATAEPAVPPDPTGARAALDAAGWRAGPDGVRVKDGLRATIEICSLDDKASAATVKLIGTQLQAVGISVVAHPATADQLNAGSTAATAGAACSLAAGNFDAALLTESSPVDPLGYFFAWHSSQISPNGTNLAAVSDSGIDQELATIAGSPDPAAIQPAMAAFQEAYRATTVEVPLQRPILVDLVQAKLGNVVLNPLRQTPTWNVGDWFRKG